VDKIFFTKCVRFNDNKLWSLYIQWFFAGFHINLEILNFLEYIEESFEIFSDFKPID
jgi:hypothetical protein